MNNTFEHRAEIAKSNGNTVTAYFGFIRVGRDFAPQAAANRQIVAALEDAGVPVRYLKAAEFIDVLETEPDLSTTHLFFAINETGERNIAAVDGMHQGTFPLPAIVAEDGKKYVTPRCSANQECDMQSFVPLFAAIQGGKKKELQEFAAAYQVLGTELVPDAPQLSLEEQPWQPSPGHPGCNPAEPQRR